MSTTLLQQALSNKAIKWISFGWIGFITENVIISDNREWIIDNYGNDNYHMAYSLLSTITSGSILYGYLRYGRGQGPKISPPTSIRSLSSFVFTSMGLIGFSQYIPLIRMPYTYENENENDNNIPSNGIKKSKLVQQNTSNESKTWRCPLDFKPKDIKKTEDGVYGMERVSRHGMFWSLGALSLGKALSTVYVPEIIMFGFPIAFAYIGGAHQDIRFLRGSGGVLSQEKYEKTSNVPFGAFLTGQQTWEKLSSELKYPNMALALATSVLLTLRRIR